MEDKRKYKNRYGIKYRHIYNNIRITNQIKRILWKMQGDRIILDEIWLPNMHKNYGKCVKPVFASDRVNIHITVKTDTGSPILKLEVENVLLKITRHQVLITFTVKYWRSFAKRTISLLSTASPIMEKFLRTVSSQVLLQYRRWRTRSTKLFR